MTDNIRRVRIPETLRNYVERFHYDVSRYTDLLNVVNLKDHPMTAEEWESSWTYFSDLLEEAKVSFETVKETIGEIYADEINGAPWIIDFIDSSLVIGTAYVESNIRGGGVMFNEKLDRMYLDSEDLYDNNSMRVNSKRTKDITIQVTEACNMACTYCYQHKKSPNRMSFDTAKNFIDMILDADERTNSYVTSTENAGAIINFIGGEPWLEIDLIDKISDYFIKEVFRRKHPWAIRFIFNVCSNGLLHFDPRVQKYIKKHINHFGYNISIDGNKELHDLCRIDHDGNGTYDRAIAGVRDYVDNFNGYIGSKMTLAPNNIDKMFEAVKSMIIEHGYRHINLNCIYEDGWTIEHARIMYNDLHRLTDWLEETELLHSVSLSLLTDLSSKPLPEDNNNNWCGGTGFMLAVDHKGDMFPCIRYMESSVSDKVPPYVIGSISEGLNCTKEHKDRVDCLSCVTRRSQSSDECFNCPIAMGCGWCSAHNYEMFGTVNKRATFICDMHKARSLANVYYQRKKGNDFPLYCPEEWAIPIIGKDEYDKLKNLPVSVNEGAGINA